MTPYYSSKQESSWRSAAQEIIDGIKYRELWYTLAVEDIRKRFVRSYAGVGWVFFSFALFTLVKTVIFTPLSDKSVSEFAPYVTLGFFAWIFMQTAISEGCNVFVSSHAWLKGTRLPGSVFVYQAVYRNCILSAVNLLVVVIVLIFTQMQLTIMALWVIPITLLFIINALWVTVLFGVLGARQRDFTHMVSTLMRVMLFLTPIFWKPEQMGRLWDYLVYNPLAHYIILFREPLQDGTIPYTSLFVVLSVTVVGLISAFVVYARSRGQLVFWL